MTSSVVTNDEFVPGRKLTVHVAENGHSFEFECDGSTLVGTVQQSIESLCGIQVNDQLLLCLDKKLESNKPLSSYKLPHDSSEVFVYNRPLLHADSPSPGPETIVVPNTVEPDPPSPTKSPHSLDDAPDPALSALPSYERQFRYHFQQGHSVYCTSQAKFETCQRLLREQHVQHKALETARGSMDQGYKVVQQSFNEFSRCYLQQHRHHSDILANLGKDIEKLRSCELHPTLQTETRKCLLDLVKGDNLRKSAESCASSHRQFENKVSQLKSMFGELKKRVESLCSDKASSAIKDLDLTIRDHQKYLNEQKSIMQSLSKDVETVKKLLLECSSCKLSDSLLPHDAVSALGRMYHVHEKNNLPKMQSCDKSVTKLFDLCKIKKNEMNLFVHHFMQKVVYVQSIIRDIRLQLPVFKEAMEHQDDCFSDLKVLRGIGPAYRACFAEVVRRKSSMKLYMGFAGQLAERLAIERENEVRKREEFLKAQSVYVPRDLLMSMGLFDTPKQCDISITPFDSNLLDIDMPDLDRYAPKYLVGVNPKWEKNLIPKGSLGISADSSNCTETEVNSLITNVKYDSFETTDGFDSVHIAGTSKLEVENAWLKAELASAVALICTISPEMGSEPVGDGKIESLLKESADRTAEALHLKDEHHRHIQSMLKMKDNQCSAYEKRIQELEQRLSEMYVQEPKLSSDKVTSESSAISKTGFWKSDISGDGEAQTPYLSVDPMDEVSCTSTMLEQKIEQFTTSLNKSRGDVDENMTDMSGTLNMHSVDYTRNCMDSSMLETHKEQQVIEKDKVEKSSPGFAVKYTHHASMERGGECMNFPSFGHAKTSDNVVSDLKNALSDKSNQCDETETKLKAAMDENNSLKKELEVSRKLLDESLMNCAHLENCLHEARELAHTNLCAADRKASEYNALRTSAVKTHGLFERFRSCVTATGGVAIFAESLRSLALSLASAATEEENDGHAVFRASIKVLADKVGILSRQRADLLDRFTKAESANGILVKEVEDKKESIKSLFTKLQIEKQANKEKISFGHLEVHELAAFVLNSFGHYEAISRSTSNYYLSSESVALFLEQHLSRPAYIIGQVVHIEQQVVKAPTSTNVEVANKMDLLTSRDSSPISSNPYNLPVGCEYFIVTVAMLPDNICSSAS